MYGLMYILTLRKKKDLFIYHGPSFITQGQGALINRALNEPESALKAIFICFPWPDVRKQYV